MQQLISSIARTFRPMAPSAPKPLAASPEPGSGVYLVKERRLFSGITISPTTLGHVHPMTAEVRGRDEVFVDWPQIGVVGHRLRDLTGLATIDA